MASIRVTIWNEYVHEKRDAAILALYPGGIHEHLRRALQCDAISVQTATLHQDEEHGLSQALLDDTDVLLWWGHMAHHELPDAIADRVVRRVHDGMGFIALHSAHASKPFTRLMGTPCTLQWREANERAHVWTVAPSHPIAQGIPLQFTLEHEEMYGEVFMIPRPDDVVFITWFQGGNVFRGGVTFTRGAGKIFYFHPGHESLPSFYNEHVLRVLHNAIGWAAPPEPRDFKPNQWVEPLEPLPGFHQ